MLLQMWLFCFLLLLFSFLFLLLNAAPTFTAHIPPPPQDRERNRIEAVGGFVNAAGRVNGNLNLSRSLGDLKYKQAKEAPPSAQMITAEPDVLTFDIDPVSLLSFDNTKE